jgi:hypothetical protein
MLYYSFVSRIHTKPQFVHVVHRYVFFIFVYYKDDNFPMEIPKNFMPSETSGASGCKEVRDVLTPCALPRCACVDLAGPCALQAVIASPGITRGVDHH